jgi:DNA-binding CsgD family transcriptional regulator
MSASSSRRRRPASGGRGGSEPRAVIVEREQQAWQLALRGRSQREIAEALGLTQAAISKLLARVERRLQADAAAQLARRTVRRHAQLQLVVREAFEGWTRSHAERTRKHERYVEASAPGRAPARLREVTAENQSGDPRFLHAIIEALATAAEMDRWHRPADPAPPATRINLAVLSPEEWAIYEQLHARLTGQRRSAAPSADGPAAPGGEDG